MTPAKADEPTLREYLRRMANTCDRNAHDWQKAGADFNSAYANGSCNAYRDIERMLEQNGFKPEPP